MRVLIVDDDRIVRRLIRTLMDREGFECYEAENGLTHLPSLANFILG
jgi:DNA-binding response OmpR family regulator